MKVRADGFHGVGRVQLVRHFVGTAHIAIQVKIVVYASDSEMMAQITGEHGSCPCFIYLFLFAKQGKQTKKTG
jgi:hypothetical protein